MIRTQTFLDIEKPAPTMKYFKKTLFIATLSVLAVFTLSCDEETVRSNSDLKTVELDSTKTNLVNVAGKLFSIPSPVQTAILIKKTKSPYHRDRLNPTTNVSNYTTKIDRALNLGVYGIDMAYASLYDDSQSALKYFKAVEGLADALEIKGAINPELVKRLGSNVGNADSLLYLSGRFYEATDIYLKENERYDLAGLVLTGAWVETVFLTAIEASAGNADARTRLAEQKTTIKTLCDVLHSSTDTNFKSGTTLAALDSLNHAFSAVEIAYEYQQPEINADKRLAIINSNTEFVMSDKLLKEISGRIQRIRASIIE